MNSGCNFRSLATTHSHTFLSTLTKVFYLIRHLINKIKWDPPQQVAHMQQHTTVGQHKVDPLMLGHIDSSSFTLVMLHITMNGYYNLWAPTHPSFFYVLYLPPQRMQEPIILLSHLLFYIFAIIRFFHMLFITQYTNQSNLLNQNNSTCLKSKRLSSRSGFNDVKVLSSLKLETDRLTNQLKSSIH